MSELRDLVSELASQHGASRLGAPWRAVLAACEDPRDASACQRVSPDGEPSIDTVLRDDAAGGRFDQLGRSDRARVEDAVWRALERAAPGFAPPTEESDSVPPADWDELIVWAAEHNLGDLFDRSLAQTASYFARRSLTARAGVDPDEMRLGAVLRGSPRAARELRDPLLLDAIRDYLRYALGRREMMAVREKAWALPPLAEGMAALADGLSALRDSIGVAEPPPPVDAGDARLHVDLGAAELVATVRTVWNTSEEIALSVFGREAGLPTLRWSQYAPPEREAWTRTLAEWWSDAVHDPQHPLHESVAEVANRAAWPRFLEELSRTLEVPDSGTKEVERVIWRVGVEAGTIELEPLIQKRGKRGWTKGRRVEREAVEGPHSDPLDERVARGLARSLADGLRGLVGHPRVVLAEDPRRGVRVEDAAIELELDEHDRTLHLWVGDTRLDPVQVLGRMATQRVYAYLDAHEARLEIAVLPDAVCKLIESAARWRPTLPPEADDGLMELLSRLPGSVGLRLPPDLAGRALSPISTPRLALVLHDGGDLEVRLRVSPLRDERRFPPGAGPVHLSGRVAGERCHTTRDLSLEAREAERWIDALGLAEARELDRYRFLIGSAERGLDLLARAAEHEELLLEWPEGKGRLRLVGTVSSLKVTARAAGDWLVLSAEIEVDEARVSLAELRRAVERGERFVRLRKGDYIRLTDELRSRVEGLGDVTTVHEGEIRARPEAALAVDRLLGDDLQRGVHWRGLTDQIRRANEGTPQVPETLDAELRDYQAEGVQWLLRLSQWASGACLADEMGLGKTVQALALLVARSEHGPSLVVAPTSLAYNWEAEAARFAPQLDVRVYRGSDRVAALENVGPQTVLVTSYDLMARDIERLGPIRFEVAIFDEAHALKNPKTIRARAASRIDAGFHLGLTGTPLENHLGELWSLFAVLVPGLLGSPARFRRRFAEPIEREQDAERREALRQLVSPFLLRRTKKQVLSELPPRTEVTRSVELTPEEMARYEAERRAALAACLKQPTDGNGRFTILAALTRLRRLACHPALVDPDAPTRSSKLTATLSLLEQLREEGRRALVFSQFTGHLRIVQKALVARGVEPLYLDGGTPAKERAALVERFQEGADPVFLISLKAGGTGLNLTAADTVLHLDPWWNPAAEDQASDRAHRIGQTKPVTVVRLIAQGTIEDKVLALHREKRELAESLLAGAEMHARLDTDDLLDLLGSVRDV